MKPTLANSVSPLERSHLFHICEKKIASNSPVGLYTHWKVKITQFHISKHSNCAEIYV